MSVSPAAVREAPAFHEPRQAGLLVPQLGHGRLPFSGVGLQHRLKGREAGGLPASPDGGNVVRVGDLFGGSPAGGVPSRLTRGGGRPRPDVLQPRGGKLPEETVQRLGVPVMEEAREVRGGGVTTELALGKVVQELLRDPVQDAKGDLVRPAPMRNGTLSILRIL